MSWKINVEIVTRSINNGNSCSTSYASKDIMILPTTTAKSIAQLIAAAIRFPVNTLLRVTGRVIKNPAVLSRSSLAIILLPSKSAKIPNARFINATVTDT